MTSLLFRVDCWSHVDRNIDKNMLIHIKDKDIRQSVKSDIDTFQNNVENDNFETVARLMLTKWKEEIGEQKVISFIKYFF